MASPEALREKAREYDLNALAADERGETDAAEMFAVLALAFSELAELEDREAA